MHTFHFLLILAECVNDAEGRTSVHFNTTAISNIAHRDQEAAVPQFVELRVHKMALSNSSISALQSAGCNTSRIIVRMLATSEETDKYITSETILSTQQLEVNEWISFRNVNQLYDSWMNDKNRTLQTIKLDVDATCGAMQSAFSTGDEVEFTPIMVNRSENAFSRRSRDRRDARLINVQRRNVLGQNRSCGLFHYTVRKQYNELFLCKP